MCFHQRQCACLSVGNKPLDTGERQNCCVDFTSRSVARAFAFLSRSTHTPPTRARAGAHTHTHTTSQPLAGFPVAAGGTVRTKVEAPVPGLDDCVCTCACERVSVCVCVCVYVCTCVCSAGVCACVAWQGLGRVCTHAHAHAIHTHRHTHAHAHTHTRPHTLDSAGVESLFFDDHQDLGSCRVVSCVSASTAYAQL